VGCPVGEVGVEVGCELGWDVGKEVGPVEGLMVEKTVIE
jgi:hypothetical protein